MARCSILYYARNTSRAIGGYAEPLQEDSEDYCCGGGMKVRR